MMPLIMKEKHLKPERKLKIVVLGGTRLIGSKVVKPCGISKQILETKNPGDALDEDLRRALHEAHQTE